MGFGDFVYWYLSTLYLKYQFKQINDKIALGLKNGNNSLLMDAIISHNSVSQSTAKLTQYSNILFSESISSLNRL
jgi:hypothetical protein